MTTARRGDLFDATCNTRRLLDRVGSRWTALIVLTLHEERDSLRFSQLRQRATGISQKMLATTLHSLERDGLVRRRVEPTSPPKVHYALTARGESLATPLLVLREWAEENIPAVSAHGREFDQAQGTELDAPAAGGAHASPPDC